MITRLLAGIVATVMLIGVAVAGPFEDAGAAYYQGDYATALRLWQPLAEQGNASGQFNLVVMYERGKGVPRDYAEAVKWYRLAAEQGHASAQYNLGLMYYDGRGVPQNYAEAASWYRMAAEQGDADGQRNLGVAYYKGTGVPQDYAEAVKWFRLAAEQSDVLGQYDLGVAYNLGKGVPQDYVLAHMWWSLAAAQGYEDAQRARDLAASRMTPDQLVEAQRLAREWKPKGKAERGANADGVGSTAQARQDEG